MTDLVSFPWIYISPIKQIEYYLFIGTDPCLFLSPGNALDWQVHKSVPNFFVHKRAMRDAMRKIGTTYHDFFEGFHNPDRPDDRFWDKHVPAAIRRAKTRNFSSHKVLRYRLLD